jgi:D-lactate dehydrogenase
LAFGTDASFYRLIPQLVIRVESEDEVVALLKLAQRDHVPVTFRAAGTSLSGQAISDSVLIVLGDNWNAREIRGQGTQIRLQPGVIGAQANAWLAPFGRKIGPDPASINACKIGGIVANNASGMCCGTAQNTYHTLAGIRLVLADGTRLDTEDAASVAAFRRQPRRICLSAWRRWAARPAPTPNSPQNPPQIPSEKYHRPVAQCLGGFR